jgi:hypothetical protein
MALAVSLALLAPGAASAGQARDLLPDLRMASLRDFHLETLADGSRRLRVTTLGVNVGQGRFELRGTRPDTSFTTMTVQQRIFTDAGWSHFIDTNARMRYAGDGHEHWHVQRFITLELYRPSAPDIVWRLNKIGFCVIDAASYRPSLPGYPAERRYVPATACGVPDSTALRPGISVGWGDLYPWDFVRQWIALPRNMRPGTYRLCATVDAMAQFRELHESNNSVWHDLSIDVATNTVREVDRAWGACRPGLGRAADLPD